MKLTKSDVTLNEKDALQDMLESEKQLMTLYDRAVRGQHQSDKKKFFRKSPRSCGRPVLSFHADVLARLLRAPTGQ